MDEVTPQVGDVWFNKGCPRRNNPLGIGRFDVSDVTATHVKGREQTEDGPRPREVRRALFVRAYRRLVAAQE